MSMIRKLSGALAASALLAGTALATPITGTPVGNDLGWTPNCDSTNELNFNQEVPCRMGQAAPYVLLAGQGPGQVTLDFFNLNPGLARFEIRIDGVTVGSTSHPVVTGDFIHPGPSLATQTTLLGQTYFADSFVDVRLALGGERDWDFDWTRFEVKPVPAPATFGLALMGLAGMLMLRKQKA